MRLLRFAYITLREGAAWPRFSVTRNGVRVSVLRSTERGKHLTLLVSADVDLHDPPSVDEEGRVEVPDAPRQEGENAIETTADLISVATGHGRSISSPNLGVAFRAETDNEWSFLRARAGVRGADRGVPVGRWSVLVDETALAPLHDREEGVALLAEALAQGHMTARYRELLRVFEHAFAESACRLVPFLAAFLALRPGVGYTKTEVKRWVVRLRGRATHADRHAPLVEADLRGVVDRMLLAAYEVVFNKQKWHSRDIGRRDVWTPTVGPLADDGRWFVVQHRTEAPMVGQLYDPYGAYPLNLGEEGLALDDRCWPQRGPERMITGGQSLAVVSAQQLRVAASS
jgi:hypothetical protein